MDKTPLPDRFPDADFVLKATMWTPARNALDMEYHLNREQGQAILFIISNSESELTDEEQAAVDLLSKSFGGDRDRSS